MQTRLLTPVLFAAALVSSALGQTVQLGNLNVDVDSELTARYRLSNTNWDMAITQGSIPPNDVVEKGLGSTEALNGDIFSFSLEHRTGKGFVWTLTETTGSTPAGGAVAWGSFSPALPAGTVVRDTLTPAGAPPSQFNFLGLHLNSSKSGDWVTLSDLVFSISLPTAGSLTGGTVNGPAGYVKMASVNSTDADLGSYDWVLSGRVSGYRASTNISGGTGDETLRFDVIVGSYIPEPSVYAGVLGLAGLGMAVFRRRRAG